MPFIAVVSQGQLRHTVGRIERCAQHADQEHMCTVPQKLSVPQQG